MEALELVEVIVKAIADHPAEVSVRKISDERGTCIFLRVAPEDMPHVIGAEGKTIGGIRQVLRSLSYKTKETMSIKVEEPLQRN